MTDRFVKSLGPVAYFEFDRRIRAIGTWLLAGVLFAAFVHTFRTTAVPGRVLGPATTVGVIQSTMVAAIPIATGVIAYGIVAIERHRRRLLWHVSQPRSRSDVVIGKALGLGCALCPPVLVSLVVGVIVCTTRYGVLGPARFLLLVLVTVLYLFVNVGVATAISAVSSDGRRAAAGVIAYFVLLVLWSPYAPEVAAAFDTALPLSRRQVSLLFQRLSPTGAYIVATNTLAGAGNSAKPWSIALRAGLTATEGAILAGRAAEQVPLLFRPAFSVVILSAWGGGSLWAAVRRFDDADLV